MLICTAINIMSAALESSLSVEHLILGKLYEKLNGFLRFTGLNAKLFFFLPPHRVDLNSGGFFLFFFSFASVPSLSESCLLVHFFLEG